MTWHRTGDKPLSEPMLTQFTDAYKQLWRDELITWQMELQYKWPWFIEFVPGAYNREDMQYICPMLNADPRLWWHRENSPVTQTSPEPTLLSWGGGPRQKNFLPPLATWQARSYRANWATQTLLFSKPLDLAQVCHRNKICSKPALTWKLTLVLAFPAHFISN